MSAEVVSAQKKRALDALERRFSVSKPELPQKPHENKRRKEKIKKEDKREIDGGRGHEGASTSSIDDGSSLKKGNFTFQGKFGTTTNAGKGSEGFHPVYHEISLSIHQNLIKPPIEDQRKGAVIVNNVIHDLLQNGDSAEKYMQGSRNMKIDNWLLLDNHIPQLNELEDARKKSLKSRSHRSKKHVSLREHRALGSFELHQKFCKFDLFVPMHEMWQEYILKLLDERRKHLGQVILTADLHGAYMLVMECIGGSFTGVRGIMIRETKEAFGIITPDDQFKVVVKKLCVFQLQAANFKVTLFGDKLSARNIH